MKSEFGQTTTKMREETGICMPDPRVSDSVDTSERRTVQDELSLVHARYQAIIQNASDIIVLVNAAQVATYVSPSVEHVLGYKPEDIIGHAVQEFAHPDEIDVTTQALRNLLENPGSRPPRAVRARHRNGQWRWLELTAVDLRTEPAVGGILLSYRDVTARNLTEVRLKESESRFRRAFEEAPIGMALLARDGRLLQVNESLCRVIGYTPEIMLGMNITDITHPEDVAPSIAMADRLFRGEIPRFALQVRYIGADGRAIWANTTGTLVEEADGAPPYAVAMLEDVTEQKQAQRLLEQQLAKLSALRAIDDAINGAMDVRVICSVILTQLLAILHIDAAVLLLLDRSLNTLDVAATRGFNTAASKKASAKLGEGIAGRVALSGKSLTISNLSTETELERREMLDAEQFIGYAAVPLVAKGLVVGALEVFHRTPLELTPEQRDFLEAIGAQAAIAVEQAQMFEKMQRSNLEMTFAYDSTIEGWSRAMDLRDHATEGHSQRVTALSMRLARAVGISNERLANMRRGALLHDVGKLGVPDSILLKPGPLTDEEWMVMRKHPVFAYEMLSPIAYLRSALEIPYCHHEHWDGTGYPRGLKGEQIPLEARLFAVVDVWDAITSERCYRKAFSPEEARSYLESVAGSQLDPECVRGFLDLDLGSDNDRL